MARFVLLGLKTSGLKSLEKTINLQFCNHDLSNFSYAQAVVKAIYGTNGEGKTAIAHTLELYKNSVVNGDYLPAQSFDGSLQELINQHSKKVYIDLYFAVFIKERRTHIFHHIVEYSVKDNRVFVSYEYLGECKNNSWGNTENETLLLETKDGIIKDIYSDFTEVESNVIKEATKNLLTNSSAAFSMVVYLGMIGKHFYKEENKAYSRFRFATMSVVMFALNLTVFIDKEDRPKVSTDRITPFVERNKITSKSLHHIAISDSDDEIISSGKEEYAREIKRIEKLLKVFKPNLEKIDVKYSDARGDKLICTKTLLYENGDRVDLAYESTGIKKMIRLFDALSSVDHGGVVFVDEFDANIHDVYLCKLIEYFLECTNGQFIFTTHNLGPMEVLDKKGIKHSIDFVNKQTVTPWRRNGNYSVVKVYRNGMIPNSPFNINSIDFIKVFGGGNKDE